MQCGSLEFAQARLQSRHGQRAGEADWQRLETTREFTALLDAARNSPLRAWVVGLTPHDGAHRIEATLRQHWRALVAELGGWMPPAWRPAMDWCLLLPLLPALQHLARGGAGRPWMQDEPLLRRVAEAELPARAAALTGSEAAALAAAWAPPQLVGAAWLAEWQRRMPAQRGSTDESLGALLALLRRHAQRFADAPAGSGQALRRALQAGLRPFVHRAVAEPAAALAHLALCALDLERLRGELLLRALFAPPAEAA